MADFFSELQTSVPTDTWDMFPITPDQITADPYVLEQLDAWIAGEAKEPDLAVIWKASDPGIMVGTAKALGEKYAGNPQVSDWVQRQRYQLAKTLKDAPPAKRNRFAGLWEQGFYKGQQTAVKNTLEGGPQGPAQPPPEPTPQATPQPGGVPDLINMLKNKSLEELQLMLEVGAISQDVYQEALAAKGIAQ
jgi:hypothetical protein